MRMVEAKTFKISPRLDYLFQQLQPGTDVWDLACDHGLVGMKAVVSGQFPSVTFVDKSVEAVEVLKGIFVSSWVALTIRSMWRLLTEIC